VSSVTVRARVDGEVVAQLVTEGQDVRRDDLLFRIDDREIRAALAKDEALLARDQATLARAQADASRARDLLARKVAAQQQVDQSDAEAKIAAANVQADQAAIDMDRIRLDYTEVRAPIDGRLGAIRVTEGNIVRSADGGDGLVTITQMKPLRVSFTLPERDLPALRAAAAGGAKVPVRVSAHSGNGALAAGELSFIDSSVDATSGTVTAKALLPNEDGTLWPGQYVDVEVELGHTLDAVTIPLVAVQPGQDGPFVFVVGSDGKAALRQITPGDTVGDRVVATSGLGVGERVVVEGQQRLQDGMRVAERAPQAQAVGARS
jgi:multidrug efflux system membrane fusion protein